MTENFTIPATTALRENHHLMADATRTNTHQVETDGLSHPNVTKKDDIPGAVPGPSKPWGEDFIKDVVNKTVDEVIRDSDYSHEATSIWVNQIVEIVVRSLVKVDRDNKYIGMYMLFILCCRFVPCHEVILTAELLFANRASLKSKQSHAWSSKI